MLQLTMWYLLNVYMCEKVHVRACMQCWREFAKCRFTHFPSFFSVHVDTYVIRSNFVKNDHSRDFPEPPHVEITMDQFTHTTTSEVRSIILKSTNASCDLDPFPTRLLNHYIADLIVPITAIINLSMREGVVPPNFKQALVTPIIKKKTLCRNEFKNYRPISNLSFLSKILEKIFLLQAFHYFIVPARLVGAVE